MKWIRRMIAVLLLTLLVLQPTVLPIYALAENVTETASTVSTAAATETTEQNHSEPTEENAAEATSPETVPPETAAETEPTVPEETEAPAKEDSQRIHSYKKIQQVPRYLQTDFAQVPYGDGTVGANGSGITALAMTATYMTDHEYSPRTLAGYFGDYPGTEAQRLEYASDVLRLPWTLAEDWETALAALENDCVVIVQMNSASIFTDSEHFVVLTGLAEDGRVMVNDPYGPHYSQEQLKAAFRNGFSQERISEGYEMGWIYDLSIMPDAPYIYEEEPAAADGMPLYDQTAYPDVRYGDGTICTSGCSIVSLAMVATYLTKHTYLPEELADYFGGYTGNNVQRLEYAAKMLKLPCRQAVNWHEVEKCLKEGDVAIVLEDGRSAFTTSQHFLVIKGLTPEGRVLVNDSYGPNYDNPVLKDGYANGFSSAQICSGYAGAWIFDVSAMPEEPFIYEEEPTPYVEPRYPELHLTAADMELLARMVWVEARGEVFEGQQAVAEVVLNRVVSGEFQDSVRGVVYADNQFKSTQFLEDATPTQTQYEAVEKALYGPYVLPINVTHFARYAVNQDVWGTIGGHTFCYQWGSDD